MAIERAFTFPGQFSSLTAIGEFVVRAAQDAGLDERAVYGVQMAVDEACSNIIEYGYDGGGDGEIECVCRINEIGMTVILRDQGEAFDPDCVPEPDTHADLEDRDGGGLGVYFMRKLTDEMSFEHTTDSGNVLTLVKRKEPPS